jgi:DNA transformation protein and related proteins
MVSFVVTILFHMTARPLGTLPNLGPKSEAMLLRAGISSERELRMLGAVNAYVAVRHVEPRASLNLLWALEGALTGLAWNAVARQHRTSLLLALDDAMRTHSGK